MITTYSIFAKPSMRGKNLSFSQAALSMGISTQALLKLLGSRGIVSYQKVNAKNDADRICVCDFFLNNGYADMYISSGKGAVTDKTKRFSQSTLSPAGINFIQKQYAIEIARLGAMAKTGETVDDIIA